MIKPLFLLLLTLYFMEYQIQSIYEGKRGLQYVYYDDAKENITIEFGYRYFGYHDYLVRIENSPKNIIAESEFGKLYKKKDNLYYYNTEHKIDVRLRREDYSDQIDKRRKNIFQLISQGKIFKLKDSLQVEYQLDSNFASTVKSDYIFYRDNVSIPENYSPKYIDAFYRSLK